MEEVRGWGVLDKFGRVERRTGWPRAPNWPCLFWEPEDVPVRTPARTPAQVNGGAFLAGVGSCVPHIDLSTSHEPTSLPLKTCDANSASWSAACGRLYRTRSRCNEFVPILVMATALGEHSIAPTGTGLKCLCPSNRCDIGSTERCANTLASNLLSAAMSKARQVPIRHDLIHLIRRGRSMSRRREDEDEVKVRSQDSPVPWLPTLEMSALKGRPRAGSIPRSKQSLHQKGGTFP